MFQCFSVYIVEAPTLKKRRRTGKLADLPAKHSKGGTEPKFASSCHRKPFVFVVDCQPLQRVVSGHSPLHAPDLDPVFQRIPSNLAQMVSVGFNPPRIWDDPIFCRKREHNARADHLVNYTMDCQSTWTRHLDWPFDGIAFDDCNYIAHSDGGTRKDQCSAAAWIIEAVLNRDSHAETKPIAMAGIYISTPVSSFLAESIALDECTSFLKQFFLRKGVSEPLGKQRRVFK